MQKKIYKFAKVFIIVAMLIWMAVTSFGSFYTVSNLSSILMSAALLGIMACGMMFPLLVSGPDLSVSGGMAVGGMVAVKYITSHGGTPASFAAGLFLALLVGALIGAVMGAAIHYFNLPSFIVTLAMQYVLYGVAQIGLKSKIVCSSPDMFCKLGNGRLFGFPIPVYVFLAFVVLTVFLMHRTVFGRKSFMFGGNRKASVLCGIKGAPVAILVFAYSGMAAALAGVIMAAMNQQASATAGTGYDTNVLLACVLGGGSMGEGIGSAGGAVYGAIFVALLNNCLRIASVPSLYQEMIVGVLIIAAMAFENYFKAKASGMHWSRKKRKVEDTRDFA